MALVLLAGGISAEDATEGHAQWKQARLALAGKDARAALAKFEDALRALPADPLLLYEAAACAFGLQEIDKAETWIDRALKTGDTAFKDRQAYEQAVALAEKVRTARTEMRRAGSREAARKKALEVVEAAVGALSGVRERGRFLGQYFAESADADFPGVRNYNLRDDCCPDPDVMHFSGGGATKSDDTVLLPWGAIDLNFHDLESEEAANEIASQIVKMAESRLPSWQRDAARRGGSATSSGKGTWGAWTEEERDWPKLLGEAEAARLGVTKETQRTRWRSVFEYRWKDPGGDVEFSFLRMHVRESHSRPATQKAWVGPRYSVSLLFKWKEPDYYR
jgi:tetratricopeptide (TPR) repeat protein